MFKNKKMNYRLIVKIELLLLTVGLVTGLVRIAYSVPKVKEAIVLATTVKPETFTELYFEDHNNLPKTIEKHEEYSFIFTIHNLEYKDMNYPYVVYLETVDKKIILDQGIVSLKDGEYKSARVDFGPLKPIRMKIVVELENNKQLIDFWMEGQNEQL